MTSTLQKAFDKASELPDEDQNALAEWLMLELAGEQKWDTAFESSSNALAELAKEAEEEYARGQTQPLNPDKF